MQCTSISSIAVGRNKRTFVGSLCKKTKVVVFPSLIRPYDTKNAIVLVGWWSRSTGPLLLVEIRVWLRWDKAGHIIAPQGLLTTLLQPLQHCTLSSRSESAPLPTSFLSIMSTLPFSHGDEKKAPLQTI